MSAVVPAGAASVIVYAPAPAAPGRAVSTTTPPSAAAAPPSSSTAVNVGSVHPAAVLQYPWGYVVASYEAGWSGSPGANKETVGVHWYAPTEVHLASFPTCPVFTVPSVCTLNSHTAPPPPPPVTFNLKTAPTFRPRASLPELITMASAAALSGAYSTAFMPTK